MMSYTIRTLIFVLSLIIITFNGCDNKTKAPTAKKQSAATIALNTIKIYADTNGTTDTPTLEDYNITGFTGVTTLNLSVLNNVVQMQDKEDIDTFEKLQMLIDEINNTPPIITMIGNSTINLNINDNYIEEGAIATDNVDGNITNNIVTIGEVNSSSIGTYVLMYSIVDSAGNEANVTRSVTVVDNIPPVISLNGINVLNLNINDNYIEEGAIATDNVDGNITNNIVTIGEVNSSSIGTYVLIYSIVDNSGNEANVTRSVRVLDNLPILRDINISIMENSKDMFLGNIIVSSNSYIESLRLEGDGANNFTFYYYGELYLAYGADIDYEVAKEFNLTAYATNETSESVGVNIHISVLDIHHLVLLETPIYSDGNVSFKVQGQEVIGETLFINGVDSGIILDENTTQVNMEQEDNATYLLTSKDANGISSPTVAFTLFSTLDIVLNDENITKIGNYVRYYTFEIDREHNLSIDMTSDFEASGLDPYLYLLDENGSVLYADDDGGEWYNSRFSNIVLDKGLYIIKATSSTQTNVGSFNLIIKDNKAAPTLADIPVSLTRDNNISAEVHGLVGDKVLVDGIEVATIGADGSAMVQLNLEEGNNSFEITLKDTSGGESDILTVEIEYTTSDIPATISLNGVSDMTLDINDTYIELGASATDYEDGNLTSSINILGTVDTSVVGKYVLVYSVVDSAGNESNVTRTINVLMLTQLKQTGQTNSYDANGEEVSDNSLKDDAFYHSGVDFNYTRDDAKDIVTDHVTGLQWQDDENVSIITKPWLTVDTMEICIGIVPELYDPTKCRDTSGDTAETYCTTLTLGGFTNWRLPTEEELNNIVNYANVNPSIDSIYFNNTASANYWSSTNQYDLIDGAWAIDFNHGSMMTDGKISENYIRCVR